MPSGPLGEGPVDHFPVSSDLFRAAFQQIPAHLIEGFPRSYLGLQQIVRVLADESPPGWKRLTSGSRRFSLGFLLVASMSESTATDSTFHARLATELGSDRRATDLQTDLRQLWSELAEWVVQERSHPDSSFHTVRPLVLGSYAESMSRIGETVEMAFPNRKDRQLLEPALRRLLTEPDPPVASIVSELSRVRRADPPLLRAIHEFQENPFRCSGIAGCLKAFLIQRLSEGYGQSDPGPEEDDSAIELLFYRADDGLLVPYLVSSSEHPGYLRSDNLPDPWNHCREVGSTDVEGASVGLLGIRKEVVRAFERGTVGLKQVDGNWFVSAGRVSADAQDAILIRNPPGELRGCAPGYLPGWHQWFKRDNSSVKSLAVMQEQVGLLRPEMAIGFTGGVRIAHAGTYLRVSGFGPRAASSNAAWWSAKPAGGDGQVVIAGQELDARNLGDGSWDCQCFDALGKPLSACSVTFISQPPLSCTFPKIAERDRIETANPEVDSANHASSFLRHTNDLALTHASIPFEPINEQGKWYFHAVQQTVVTDQPMASIAAEHLEHVRTARDDLLRVLIGRSCDRSTPVGWGAFADDLQLVMNRRNPDEGKWTFRHAGAILRAWEEAGFIDIVNRPWAGLCVVPRTPRWTVVDLKDGAWRAIATGLIGPQQRDLLLQRLRSSNRVGGTVHLKHAINPYVPSVIQVDGRGETVVIEGFGREVGLLPAERLTGQVIRAALNALEPFGSLSTRMFDSPLDRGRFAEDSDQREPMLIGDVSIQRTRATGFESRWFLRDHRLGSEQGLTTTSRNWAYLLARSQAQSFLPLHGVGGIIIPLKDGMPDCFLPICVGRAMSLCGSCLPGPFTKGTDRFYGIPMNSDCLQIILRILR